LTPTRKLIQAESSLLPGECWYGCRKEGCRASGGQKFFFFKKKKSNCSSNLIYLYEKKRYMYMFVRIFVSSDCSYLPRNSNIINHDLKNAVYYELKMFKITFLVFGVSAHLAE